MGLGLEPGCEGQLSGEVEGLDEAVFSGFDFLDPSWLPGPALEGALYRAKVTGTQTLATGTGAETNPTTNGRLCSGEWQQVSQGCWLFKGRTRMGCKWSCWYQLCS